MRVEYHLVDHSMHELIKGKKSYERVTKEVRGGSIILNVVRITEIIGSSFLCKGMYKF